MKKEEGAALTSRDRWADLPPWMFERDFIKRARYTGIKLHTHYAASNVTLCYRASL